MGLDTPPVIREAATGDAGAVLNVHRAVLEERDFFITLPNEFGGNVYGVVQRIVKPRSTLSVSWWPSWMEK